MQSESVHQKNFTLCVAETHVRKKQAQKPFAATLLSWFKPVITMTKHAQVIFDLGQQARKSLFDAGMDVSTRTISETMAEFFVSAH